MFRTFQETFYAGDVNLKELGARCSAFWEAYLQQAHTDIQAGHVSHEDGKRLCWFGECVHREPSTTHPSTHPLTHSPIHLPTHPVTQPTIAHQPLPITTYQVSVEHVQYSDTIKDPIGTVKRLYASFGWEYSKEFDAELIAYLDKNNRERKAKVTAAAAAATVAANGGGGSNSSSGSNGNATGHAAHTYSLEEYGLDEGEMRERLGWYYSGYLQKQ